MWVIYIDNSDMFDFKHIRPFERSLVDSPGPMVLFATPGMLHAGLSLEVFKKWAPNELSIQEEVRGQKGVGGDLKGSTGPMRNRTGSSKKYKIEQECGCT